MQKSLLEEMAACKEQSPNVYRTLKKIQAGMYRIGFNLWDIFKKLDPQRTYAIPETKFLSVLNGPLRQLIGLNEEEILSVSSLFKKPDGYVTYEQFCQLIHDYRPPPETMEEIEREDPYTVNKNLTNREERILYETLTCIAVTVTKKRLLLRPFFQDYEMIKKNNGVITKTTFFKVLDFMGAKLERRKLDVLVKRYMRDNYSIKYNAFLKELDEVFDYLEKNDFTDETGQLWDPTKIPIYEKPSPGGQEIGLRQVFLPSWKEKSNVDPREVDMIIRKIKDHVYRNKIRMRDFFEEFDPTETDRVEVNDFIMGLRWLSYGRMDTINLYLTTKEIDLLTDLYTDPTYPERKVWKVFEDDVEEKIDQEEMKKWPRTPLDIPSQTVTDRYALPDRPPKKCETVGDMMCGFKLKMVEENVDLAGAFLRIDEENSGYISKKLFLEALAFVHVFLTELEMNWICQLYMNQFKMINWKEFIKDVVNTPLKSEEVKPMSEEDLKKKKKKEELKLQLAKRECNIIEVLAKIKSTMRCFKAKINDYMEPYDKDKTGLITVEQFLYALKVHDLKLSETEYKTLLDVFCYPENNKLVEYTKFTRTVDETSIRPCLMHVPLKEAMQLAAESVAKPPTEYEFLNYRDRQVASVTMKKLNRFVTLGNLDYFKSLDKDQTGTIDRYTFMSALHHLKVLHMITVKELDTLMKCFGIMNERDQIQIYYTDFLNGLDIVFKNQKAAEFV